MTFDSEPDGEASYVNALLTTLAKGPHASVTLTPGRDVPRLAPFATDPDELAWIASLPFDYDALDGTKVVTIVLTLAGWRFFHVRRRRYELQARLALPNQELIPVRFMVTRDWVLTGPITITKSL